jgi:hypothetical protein
MAFSNSVEWKFWDEIEWSIYMESEVFVESLWLDCICFVKIDNSPSLMLSIIVTPDSDGLTFFILGTSNIKYFTILPIDELVVLILEYLEPSWVSRPDLHVVSFTSWLNVPRLVVQPCSDSQRLLMEVPYLSFSTIGSFDYHVSVVDQINISIFW